MKKKLKKQQQTNNSGYQFYRVCYIDGIEVSQEDYDSCVDFYTKVRDRLTSQQLQEYDMISDEEIPNYVPNYKDPLDWT